MKNSYLGTRNIAIDILRAITMTTMLMVNDFWSVNGIPHWMQHAGATEDMLGFSDIVFPTFLFCVGLSIPYSLYNMKAKGKSEGDVIRHILERSFALILMGAFICNYEYGIDPAVGYDKSTYSILMTIGFFLTFSYYSKKNVISYLHKIVGWAILLYLLITSRSPEGATFYPYWWGILGLIGWSYLFCALVFALSDKLRTRILVWIILFVVCLTCTSTASYSAWEGHTILNMQSPNIVNLVMSNLHIDNASSHLMVMSGALFSTIFVGWSQEKSFAQRAVRGLALALILALCGALFHQVFIISKIIGTLPWIFYTLSIDVVLYLLFDYLVLKEKTHWFKPLQYAGTATLTCYMIPYLLYPIISKTIGWDWSYAVPEPLGIVKCIMFSALCVFITWFFVRMSVKLKI